MKKINILLIITVLCIFAYQAINYILGFLLTRGTPVFNNSIRESKNHKTFINSYVSLDSKEDLFNEVWIEKKAYWSKEDVKVLNIYTLLFNFKKEIKAESMFEDLNFKDVVANFEYEGIGSVRSEQFVLEIYPSDTLILKKDTLKVSFLYNKKYINKVLVKSNTRSVDW